MQNERICLLLILVEPESTVCPEKGKVSRTSYSKSITYPEEGWVFRTNRATGGSCERGSTRIRIMHKNKVPCTE